MDPSSKASSSAFLNLEVHLVDIGSTPFFDLESPIFLVLKDLGLRFSNPTLYVEIPSPMPR